MKMRKCLACECRVVEVESVVVLHRDHRVVYKEWGRICKYSKFDEEKLWKTKQQQRIVLDNARLSKQKKRK